MNSISFFIARKGGTATGLLDSILQKLSTKDPEKVTQGHTVADGRYSMGYGVKLPLPEANKKDVPQQSGTESKAVTD